MKFNLLGLFLGLTFFSSTVLATEYIYRDLMANTLPSSVCAIESEAIAAASKLNNIKNYSKRFCQSQGYGWHVEAVKDNGKAICNECGNSNSGMKKCHLEDVVVTCKRIKPGSVGMLPGKN